MSFLNRGLLISTSITILLCGAVMYLCHLRMTRLEEAVSRQNKVIASFLENVQRDVALGAVGGAGAGPSGLAAPSACAAAEAFVQQSASNQTHLRIPVSDDEADDEDDTESDADSDDESALDLDLAGDVPRLTVTEIHTPDVVHSTGEIKLVHLDAPVTVPVPEVQVVVSEDSESEDSEDEDSEDEPEPSPEPSPSPHPSSATKDKIKVEDLRKQAIDANLCTKEQAKKLKKAALVALIQTSQGASSTLTITDLDE